MFSACAALSSGVFTDDEMVNNESWDTVFKDIYGKTSLKGKDRLTESWKQNSIIALMHTQSLEEIKKVRWYLDCGDDDFLYKGNSTLHIEMKDRKIVHEFRIRDGVHNWTYWRTGITDALKFIGESFRR